MSSNMLTLLYAIFCGHLLFASSRSRRKEKCRIKYDLHECLTSGKPQNDNKCRHNGVCRKAFHLTYINLQPYNEMLVKYLLDTCCGNCVNLTVTKIKTVSKVPASNTNESHFIFPVLGRPTKKHLYGYHFIPYVEAPPLIYITAKNNNLVENLIIASLYMWPLLVICLMLVIVSGFIAWAIETWGNKEEFPREFLIGWFEGTWWSFISMTTVGYGDRKPKSVLGRIFAVIWVLIGLTVFSIVTAMLTSEIQQANSPPIPTLEGLRVAALRHRVYDASLIANKGGILVDVYEKGDTEGIVRMVQMLKKNDIDGFILDRFTFIMFTRHYSRHLRNGTNKELREAIEFLLLKCIFTEKMNQNKLSYGMLVTFKDDYDYFADFVLDNREAINTCNGLKINTYKLDLNATDVVNPLFSTSGKIFWPTFAILLIVICAMSLFGFFYELHRRGYFRRFVQL